MTGNESRPRIALIGLGTMGAGMAERLLERGFAVDVWNRTPGPAAQLAERGAKAHVTPEQAVADADVVVTMLPTGDTVKAVMIDGGALRAMHAGAVWAQMGTIGVEATEALRAKAARDRPEVHYFDAPVTGSREPARTGGLVVLASGPTEARAIVEPVFAALGRAVWLGDGGAGSRMKLVLNTWLAFEVEAAAEVSALAERLGVPQARLHEAVAGGALASGVATAKMAKMESGDFSPDFSLDWALKDLDLATSTAGVDVMPVGASIATRWRLLISRGYGRLDISAARKGLGAAKASAAL